VDDGDLVAHDEGHLHEREEHDGHDRKGQRQLDRGLTALASR
jgi:hypothetical protein